MVYAIVRVQALYVINNTSLYKGILQLTINGWTTAVIFIPYLKIFPKPAKMLYVSYNVNFS